MSLCESVCVFVVLILNLAMYRFIMFEIAVLIIQGFVQDFE